MSRCNQSGSCSMHPTFAQIFSIGLGQPQLDFVDIAPQRDTALFIDPFAISMKKDEWSRSCHTHITDFFHTALNHIRENRNNTAKQLLNGLSEPNETCLGLSRGAPSGRGVGGKQAIDLHSSLANSQAAKTGLLEELADFDLFVEGIGTDKISDITTNIIRRLLIEYTQKQCELHNIKLEGNLPSGRYWDIEERIWKNEYVELPIYNEKPIILVPKYSVRRSLSINSQEYYSHHIVNYIQQEEFTNGSSLVRTLRSGERRLPYKKDIKEKFPFSKDFLARFSNENPEILKSYKDLVRSLPGAQGTLSNTDFEEDFDETTLAKAISKELKDIAPGSDAASKYHKAIIGTLEFIFWPNLIYPQKESEIHDGRKRIDIKYTNAAEDGFFHRASTSPQTAAQFIVVECKNYSKDPANPEIDQLAGRFSNERGKLGLLLYRSVENYDLLIKRCRDTARDGRGYMLPLGDEQIIEYLELISSGKRQEIDRRLTSILSRLTD